MSEFELRHEERCRVGAAAAFFISRAHFSYLNFNLNICIYNVLVESNLFLFVDVKHSSKFCFLYPMIRTF